MKKIKEEIIGINNIKLNIFKRLTLSNCKKLNKLFFNSVSLCDKLTQELSQFCPINDNTIMKNNSEEMQIKKLIIKKIRINKKKSYQFNRFNNTYTKKFITNRKNSFFSSEKKNQENVKSNKKEDSTFNSSIFDKTYKNFYHCNNSSNKKIKSIKKINEIKYVKNKLFNKVINYNISGNSRILETNYSLLNNDNINKYLTFRKDKTLISPKKSLRKILSKKSTIDPNQSPLKNISNESISKYANKSKSLNTIQIKKNFLHTRRNNNYHIKNLFLEISRKNIGKKIESKINGDINIKKVYKEMKLFSKNLKERINHTKTVKIKKKIADIIKMDDLSFCKNNKGFVYNYPFLSKIRRKDIFKRNYKKIK